MQFSIQLIPWESMPTFKKASKAIIPFVWVELLASLTGFNRIMIWLLSSFLNLLPVLRWMALAGSVGIIFIGCFLTYRYRKNNMIVQIQN